MVASMIPHNSIITSNIKGKKFRIIFSLLFFGFIDVIIRKHTVGPMIYLRFHSLKYEMMTPVVSANVTFDFGINWLYGRNFIIKR